MKVKSAVQQFIDSLRAKPGENLFNPWFERDREHDLVAEAPDIRRRQFRAYLEERMESAKYLLIAEALGYQGGHFTGIAMTSERILLGHHTESYGVMPRHVFSTVSPLRTSHPRICGKGMSEPTATIMWGAITEAGIDPYEVVLWNAVPWHPYDPVKGILSNRTPTRAELDAGLGLLRSFLRLFRRVRPVAVGRKCEDSLNRLNIEHVQVRHPANGGAPQFRRQFSDLVNGRYPVHGRGLQE